MACQLDELMEAIVNWIREESLGNDGGMALREVRAMADKMMCSQSAVSELPRRMLWGGLAEGNLRADCQSALP